MLKLISIVMQASLSQSRSVVIFSVYIMLKSLYNVDPLTHHFYIVKLGFIGINIFILIFALKHRLWVLVRTVSMRQF